MNKLKNIDFKGVLINHGEKFCLGIVGLIAVFALVGTSWGKYSETSPADMKAKVKSSRQTMRDSKFTPEDAKEFLTIDQGGPNPNIRENAKQLNMPLDLASYEYSAPMTWPVIEKGQPIRPINYARPRDVIATADRTLIPLNPRAAAVLEESSKDMEMAAMDKADATEEEPVESEFDRRKGNRGAFGSAFGASGSISDENYDDGYSDDESYGAEGQYPGGAYGSSGGYSDDGMVGMEKKAIPARGVQFASVRAIYPLREQQREVAKAMGIQATDERLEQLVYLIDLNVERMTAGRGSEKWSGEWVPVDIQSALDVLGDSDGIESDVVQPDVTDPAITMPLPPRMVGYWDKVGSHPALRDFQLSALDQELLRKRDEQLLKFGEEIEAASDISAPAQKGGFASTLVNINGYRSSLTSGEGAYDSYSNALNDITNALGEESGTTNLGKRLKELDGATASGQLLLIRFLDFTVIPGREYKYRVRVELRNPLFNLPIEELENPELASRRTWQTDWSDVSDSVKVPTEYQYFVNGADERMGRETQAEIDVFQWFKEAGSLINGMLKVSPGQFIGVRSKKTEVLRYDAETFKEESVAFSTDDLLIDVAAATEVDPDDHPALKIPRTRGGFRLPAEILVMNRFFEVKAMDEFSVAADRRKARDQYQEMVTANEDLKQVAQNLEDPNGLYGEYGDEYGGEYGGGGEYGDTSIGVGGRSSRSRRRRGKRSPLGMNPDNF